MPDTKTLMFKTLTGFHRVVYRASKGRVFGKAKGMPVLELETIGRKTGKARSTMLTAPVHDDHQYVLVASKGGDDHHPHWFLNLRENPSVKVTIDGETREMTAAIATVEEKAELWPAIVAANDGYAGYQKKTDRDIPVVVLTF